MRRFVVLGFLVGVNACSHSVPQTRSATLIVQTRETVLGKLADVACVRKTDAKGTTLLPQLGSPGCGIVSPVHLKVYLRTGEILRDDKEYMLPDVTVPKGRSRPMGEILVRRLDKADTVYVEVTATCVGKPLTGLDSCEID